jgi:integrase/recombinase XerD
MLIAHVERYISLRQTLGFKLRDLSFNLSAFARFAAGRGETYIGVSTAVEWATAGSSPHARYIRLRDVARLARFLHAEDPTHEVPTNPFYAPMRRRLPYIYTPEEIVLLNLRFFARRDDFLMPPSRVDSVDEGWSWLWLEPRRGWRVLRR